MKFPSDKNRAFLYDFERKYPWRIVRYEKIKECISKKV